MLCSWQVEIDDYATRVLEKHWPDVRRYRDVKEVGSHNLAAVDVIAGGFPCQPHSVAGKRKGADDDRNLWPEYLRIVKELQPTWVIGENVPGIITTYLDTVISDLESAGYEVATFNLPAVAFDAPHRRERIFVVAYAESKRFSHGNDGELLRQTSGEIDTFTNSSGNSGGHGKPKDGQAVGNPEYTRQPTAEIARSLTQRSDDSTPWENATIEPTRPGEQLEVMADTERQRLQGQSIRQAQGVQSTPRSEETGNYWLPEPNVGRVAHGIPSRVDRLKGLGNAVVPAVAEFIGRAIVAAHKEYNP